MKELPISFTGFREKKYTEIAWGVHNYGKSNAPQKCKIQKLINLEFFISSNLKNSSIQKIHGFRISHVTSSFCNSIQKISNVFQ